MAGRLLFVILMYSFHKIQVQAPLPPKLTVNSLVITETDSVTMNCQSPSYVSVSQCYFFTLSRGTVRVFPCLKTLTGTELLLMAHQRSPAEIKVKCFYTVKLGDLESPSPYSDTSSITIHSQKPKLSLQHFHSEHVLFTCTLPGSANNDTSCFLYFGEASAPVLTTTIWRKRKKTKQWFCQFTVTIMYLLRHLHFLQQSNASCDYSLGSEPTSLSPRSDGYSLTDIVNVESRMMQTIPIFTLTTGLTVSRPPATTPVTPAKRTSGFPVGRPSNSGSFSSTFLTSVKPASGSSVSTPGTFPATPLKTASEPWIWKFVVFVAGCGVTVGVILLVSAILCKRRRAGSKEAKRQESQNENFDTYHLYSTISEEPAALALKDMVYSTVQTH